MAIEAKRTESELWDADAEDPLSLEFSCISFLIGVCIMFASSYALPAFLYIKLVLYCTIKNTTLQSAINSPILSSADNIATTILNIIIISRACVVAAQQLSHAYTEAEIATSVSKACMDVVAQQALPHTQGYSCNYSN